MNKTFALLACGALALAAQGCGPLTKSQPVPFSAETAHPITVQEETANLSLEVPAGAAKLPPEWEAQTRAFLAMYRARGHGPLTIARPTGGPYAAGAARVADAVAKIARAEGIPAQALQSARYDVKADGPKAVLMTFTRYTAQASPCGAWPQNANRSFQNEPLPDYGCASQNNLAAMVEDPHDLIAPRTMEAADAERRATVFNTYRKGDTAGAKISADQRAYISKIGGSE